jgi:hypothetical protein
MSSFQIFIDRLKGGEVLKIKESLDPSFLGVDEPDLRFAFPVAVRGKAYLTDSDLILQLDVQTDFLIPCTVCNEMIQSKLKVDNFYHAVPVEEIRGAVFDYTEALREALLIDVPKYMECNNGKCAERATLAPYMKKTAVSEEKKSHFPFADLDK